MKSKFWKTHFGAFLNPDIPNLLSLNSKPKLENAEISSDEDASDFEIFETS